MIDCPVQLPYMVLLSLFLCFNLILEPLYPFFQLFDLQQLVRPDRVCRKDGFPLLQLFFKPLQVFVKLLSGFMALCP